MILLAAFWLALTWPVRAADIWLLRKLSGHTDRKKAVLELRALGLPEDEARALVEWSR